VKNNDTNAYGIDYIEKAVAGVGGGSGTGGLDVGVLGKAIIIKYDFQRTLYSLTYCDYSSAYTESNHSCTPCPVNTLTLSVQSTSTATCYHCRDLYNTKKDNAFKEASYT
jgi:hypothetical protein